MNVENCGWKGCTGAAHQQGLCGLHLAEHKKRAGAGHDEHSSQTTRDGIEAMHRREKAEVAIIQAALNFEKHAKDADLALLSAVRAYKQAEADIFTAQKALDERARSRG